MRDCEAGWRCAGGVGCRIKEGVCLHYLTDSIEVV